jgi:hypothetical protein
MTAGDSESSRGKRVLPVCACLVPKDQGRASEGKSTRYQIGFEAVFI